jgi:hypothetical protein
MFLTQDHPTSRVFYHCAEQICNLLNLSFKQSFTIDSININHTKLQDSVYASKKMMYPISDYSIKHYGYTWSKDIDIDNIFYKNILCNYLESNNIN